MNNVLSVKIDVKKTNMSNTKNSLDFDKTRLVLFTEDKKL